MKKNLLLVGLIALSILQSCKKKTTTTDTLGKYEEGVYVVNEGNFGQGNASLSFVDKDLETISIK